MLFRETLERRFQFRRKHIRHRHECDGAARRRERLTRRPSATATTPHERDADQVAPGRMHVRQGHTSQRGHRGDLT